MTINETQDQVIEEFALFDDWTDKYEYIIDLGKKLPPLDDQYKTEDNKIKGCQSTVWLHARCIPAELKGDQLVFEAESEAVIVKGLVSLLIRVLSGHTPEEIAQAHLYFMERIGMHQHLAQTRSNGLASMVKQMKMYALAYQAKLN